MESQDDLSQDQLLKLCAIYLNNPIPHEDQFATIANDVGANIQQVSLFYRNLERAERGDVQEQEPNEESQKKENQANGSEPHDEEEKEEEVPMHLTKSELATMKEVFEKNPISSAEELRKYAADFGVHEAELAGWFHEERIEINHRQVLEKRQAKRMLSEETEKGEGSSPLKYHPPPKRVPAVQRYGNLLERREKVSEHAELLKIQEKYQAINQRHQKQSKLTEDRQKMKEKKELEKNEIDEEESKMDADKDFDNKEFDD